MGNNGRMDQKPENVGTCPVHHLQLKARNLVFKIFRREAPTPHPLTTREINQLYRGALIIV